MQQLHITLIMLVFCSGCAISHSDRSGLGAVIWMQDSEEYRALTFGAYDAARTNLDKALEDETWAALSSRTSGVGEERPLLDSLPAAVILDIDDTVLSTSSYQAWLLKNDRSFSQLSWNAWLSDASAVAVPGALEFVQYARDKGVTVFYLSNRSRRGALDSNDNGHIDPDEEQLDLKPFTVSNLLRLGFLPQAKVSNENSVLLLDDVGSDGRVKPSWASWDKSARRESIARDYRILLLMGDSINDFVAYRRLLDDGDAPDQERDTLAIADRYRTRWGRSWIMLPNPVHGSWESRLYDFRRDVAEEEKIKIKLNRLESWQNP